MCKKHNVRYPCGHNKLLEYENCPAMQHLLQSDTSKSESPFPERLPEFVWHFELSRGTRRGRRARALALSKRQECDGVLEVWQQAPKACRNCRSDKEKMERDTWREGKKYYAYF